MRAASSSDTSTSDGDDAASSASIPDTEASGQSVTKLPYQVGVKFSGDGDSVSSNEHSSGSGSAEFVQNVPQARDFLKQSSKASIHRNIFSKETSARGSHSDDIARADAESDNSARDFRQDDGSNSDSGIDDAEIPLGERLRKQAEHGSVDLSAVRQRRKAAKEEAKQRLAAYRAQNSLPGRPAPAKAKASKHAPTEVSSKRKDFYDRKKPELEGLSLDVTAHRYRPRDPRASSLTGNTQTEHVEQQYAFLTGMRAQEVGDLQTRIAARKLKGRKGRIQRHKLGVRVDDADGQAADQERLQQLRREQAEIERRDIERATKRNVKAQTASYYPKRQERKQLELAAKLEEIRKRKGDQAVDKVISKRRKRQKSRDARRLRRQTA